MGCPGEPYTCTGRLSGQALLRRSRDGMGERGPLQRAGKGEVLEVKWVDSDREQCWVLGLDIHHRECVPRGRPGRQDSCPNSWQAGLSLRL